MLCEIGVHPLPSGRPSFVAWAFEVRADGRLDPLYDECGRLYRAVAAEQEAATLEIRERLSRRFGPEATVEPGLGP